MKIKHNNLHDKILYNNILTMIIFIVLICMIITFILCSFTKQKIISESNNQLEQYTNSLKDELDNAVIQLTNITKSTYISNTLNKKNLTTVEIIELFDYAKDYLSTIKDNNDDVKIYTSNKNIFENIFFSHIENLYDYDEILKKFETENLNLFFSDKISYNEFNHPVIEIYGLMSSKNQTIIHYKVTLPAIEKEDFPIVLYHKNSSKIPDSNYLTVNVIGDFYCSTPINTNKIAINYVFIIISAFIVLMLLIFAIIAFSRHITTKMYKEINDFITDIDEVELIQNNNILQNTYELYELNIMKKTLQDLALKIQDYSYSANRLEIELLTKKLDPHMLYNSLSLIRLEGFKDNNNRIMELIDSMIFYYRDVLKKDRNFITIGEEIETIKKYIRINELSLQKEIKLNLHIQKELMNFNIPPQLFHTFIENSVIHGLCGSREDCIIEIKIVQNDESIITEIYDNGYGISNDTLALLNNDIENEQNVGISNSIKRLKLAFGPDSTVRFESQKNAYTKAIIKFRYVIF